MYPEEDGVWLIIADPARGSSPLIRRVLVSMTEINAVAELVRGSELSTVAQDAVVELCARLLAPLASETNAYDALVLAVHGPLHFLPLAAAPTTDSMPLMESCPVVTLPSSSFLKQIVDVDPLPAAVEKPITIIAGPDRGNEISVTNAVENLIQRLQALPFNRPVRLLERMAKAGSAEVVIIVAHGKPEDVGVGPSQVLLRDQRGRAAWINGGRLAKALGRARFAYLAICRSATTAVAPDDEPSGLVWPLLSSGCNTVVSSLWNVEPGATASFVTRLFEEASAGRNAGWALARAVGRQRRDSRYSDLRDWGGFVLYGDWRTRINL